MHITTLEPATSSWAELTFNRWRERTDSSISAREQLGLPTDKPIIMSGHQAEPWHPGILAKFIAAGALASAIDTTTAWLIVDQDTGNTRSLSVPAYSSKGRLVRSTIPLAEATDPDVPLACQNTFLPGEPDLSSVRPDSALLGVQAWIETLRTHFDAVSAAAQAAHATIDLTSRWCSPDHLLFATNLAKTRFFAEFLEEIRRNPRTCVQSYNEAVGESPSARIAPLQSSTSDAELELPLWVMPETFGLPRQRATYAHLAHFPPHRFMPRALATTALMRAFAADLFIHGRGGARYDIITERWIHNWLDIQLAPAVIASTDLTLPLADCPVHLEDVNAAFQRHHKALHDPAILADEQAAVRKSALVENISAMKDRGESPAKEFAQMHAMLRKYRARHAHSLNELATSAIETRRRYEETDVITARDWAFFLYPGDSIDELSDLIRSKFVTS